MLRASVPLAAVTDLPRFTAGSVFAEWGMDPYLFVGTVWVAGLYLLGVWALRAGRRLAGGVRPFWAF